MKNLKINIINFKIIVRYNALSLKNYFFDFSLELKRVASLLLVTM